MICWKKWKPLPAGQMTSIMPFDEMVDEYEQEEILEYFKGCETSSYKLHRKNYLTWN